MAKKEKVVIGKVQQGVCPYCGSQNIDYSAADFEDDMVHYPAHCDDCGRDFEEWYNLEFAGHNVGTNRDIEAVEGKTVEYARD